MHWWGSPPRPARRPPRHSELPARQVMNSGHYCCTSYTSKQEGSALSCSREGLEAPSWPQGAAVAQASLQLPLGKEDKVQKHQVLTKQEGKIQDPLGSGSG